MTTTRARRAGAFMRAVIALVGLFGLVPAGLIAVARVRFGSPSPFGGVAAPWNWNGGAIGESLRNPLSDDVVIDVIIRICLVAAWAAIVSIGATTALETVHLMRHHGISMPAVRGLGWAQRIAQFIAAGLLVLTPVVAPRASLATALDAGRIAFGADAPGRGAAGWNAAIAPPDVDRDVTSETARSSRRHVVAPGESIYSIAEDLAATSPLSVIEVADEILDLNLGTEMKNGQCFTSPAYIEVGWELLLPASPVRPSDRVPVNVHRAEPRVDMTRSVDVDAESAEVAAAATTHVVQPGDTLWSIAERHVGDAAQWTRIWEANAGSEMGDGRFFDDPDTILAGWELTIPGGDIGRNAADAEVVAQPASDEAATPSTAEATDAPDTTVPPDSADSEGKPAAGPATTIAPGGDIPTAPPPTPGLPDVDISDVDTAVAPEIAPVAAAPATTRPAAPTTTPSTTSSTTAAGDMSEIAARSGVAPSKPAPLRFEHAALFAAGVLTLVGVRRHAQLRGSQARSRVPPPLPNVVATQRRLSTGSGTGERSARIDVAVRAAAHALIGSDAQIGLVLVGDDGTIELWLTRRAELPTPWAAVASSGGRRWALSALVSIEELADAARRVGAPCVALVPLGVADGRDVLIDLEACATLVVESAPDAAREVVTALATGLATTPAAEVAHLIGVSLPVEAWLDHRNAHLADTAGSAFELAAALVGSTIASERTTFALRSLRTGGEVWEPAVILLLPDDVEPHEIEPMLPNAGHGLAVVVAAQPGSLERVRTRLVCRDGSWCLHAFGGELHIQPIGISGNDLSDLIAVVDDAGAALTMDDEAAIDGTEAGGVPTEHAIMVRLMGDIDIVSHTGQSGSFERSKAVELIAWLATHREKSTRAAARTAMWDLDVRDATFANVVSEARRGLGRLVEPADGEEWLARTLTEQLPLHAAVVTDSQLIEQRLIASRRQPTAAAIETLRSAAEMVRGMPFAGTGYLWPDAEGITSNLVLLAIAVSTELAQHALEVGDIELVFWATGRGLTVLPGHEELIGLRMRAHATSGDLAGVRSEWESYERVIVADPWSDGEPAPKLVEIRRELLA